MSLRPAQTRTGSLTEAATNVVVGYGLALATQALVFPLFSIANTLAQDGMIAGVFTLVSLVRSYVLQRLFERWAGSHPLGGCRPCAGVSPSRAGSS